MAFQGIWEELGYFNSLVGINKFLSHVIKKVPASVSKGALKESQCDEADVGFLEILKCVLWFQPEILSCGCKGQGGGCSEKGARGLEASSLPSPVSAPPAVKIQLLSCFQ